MRESHGRLELAYSGRVIGSREIGGFPSGSGLVVVVSADLGRHIFCALLP